MDKIITKKCEKCGGTSFYKRGQCKTCKTLYNKKYYPEHRETRRTYTRKYGRAHRKEKTKRNRKLSLKRNYGIDNADYDRMFAAQDGVCAICGQPERNGSCLSIDHNHKTGIIRGLLCRSCKGDSPELLKAALEYLQRSSQKVI